jgi:hypothetical protein
MILLLYFGVLLIVLAIRRPASPGVALVLLYIGSLACGVLLGFDYQPSTLFETYNLVFTGAMLTAMISEWKDFPFAVRLAAPPERRVLALTRTLFAIHALGFVVHTIACYYAFSLISVYSAFKNSSDNTQFYFDIPLNHTLHLFTIYLNPTAAFLVPLHFYYLTKRRYFLSALSLIFSLNIVLEGISIFSRSTIVYYFMLYALYLGFYYTRLERRPRHFLTGAACAVLVLACATFYDISRNRFDRYYAYGDSVYSQSGIQSPELYSVLDYLSQWYVNGNTVLAAYDFQTLNGELSFPVVPLIADKLGLIKYPPESINYKLEGLWGLRRDKFVGIVTNLVFDFGYIGTGLFVALYAGILRKLRPGRRPMQFATLLVLGPMFVLPAMGFTNSLMKTVGYNLLIAYSIVVYAYLGGHQLRRKAAFAELGGALGRWPPGTHEQVVGRLGDRRRMHCSDVAASRLRSAAAP